MIPKPFKKFNHEFCIFKIEFYTTFIRAITSNQISMRVDMFCYSSKFYIPMFYDLNPDKYLFKKIFK